MKKKGDRSIKPEKGSIADLIQQSVEFYKEDRLEEVNGVIQKTGTFDMLAIPFETMLFSFAEIIIQLFQKQIEYRTGSAPDLEQIQTALGAGNKDLLTYFGVWADLHTFLVWWLKQQAGLDLGAMWCDFETIARLYNEQLEKRYEEDE